MKLVKKIVSRATENILLQIETIIQISAVVSISIGAIGVFLVYQPATKIFGLIFVSLMWLLIIWILYLRFVLSKVIVLVLHDSIDLKLYEDMLRVQSRKNLLSPLGQHIVRITKLSKVEWLYLKGDFQAAKENMSKYDLKKNLEEIQNPCVFNIKL